MRWCCFVSEWPDEARDNDQTREPMADEEEQGTEKMREIKGRNECHPRDTIVDTIRNWKFIEVVRLLWIYGKSNHVFHIKYARSGQV